MPVKRKCELCDWWAQLYTAPEEQQGTCHVKAPHPFPTCSTHQMLPLPVVRWPVTKANDFCSLFQADSGYEN